MLLFALLILVLATCHAQSTAGTQPDVPVGTSIAGDYSGALRPQVHYSPPTNFMNDPNGLFRDGEGLWHMYYQYNPTSPIAGNQHWGHTTSPDLYHWTNQPIAIYPYNSTAFIFTGSIVIDTNNTSGFFPTTQTNGVVAIFTIANTDPAVNTQSQGLAYSVDGGYGFEMYEGNPVLDIDSADFRDPKVIWYEDHWVMAVAYSADLTIGIYTSTNLREWNHASNFSHHGLLGLLYECPNLVSVPVDGADETMWLMFLSINPGAPLGGSISQFFPGTFDGYTFTAVDGAMRLTDWAKDNYAGQFFYNTPGEAISIAWGSNWQYCNDVPTGELEGFRSVMSLPRKNSLRQLGNGDWALVSKPYDLSPVFDELLMQEELKNSSFVVDYASVDSNALYFEANITNGDIASGGSLNFTFLSPVSGESLRCGVFLGTQQPAFIDRGGIQGFDNIFFTDKFNTTTAGGIINVAGVIDRSILELFLNDAASSATITFYPKEPLTIMSVRAANILPSNVSILVAVYALKSAGQVEEDEEGIVFGNTTTSNSTGKSHAAHLQYDAHF